jgi:similar to stage IV sporulation protein
MLLELIRLSRGTVSFTVDGRFPERFLNITARNGIPVWDTVRRGESIHAAMYMRGYRRIRPLARAAGVKLHITDKRGLPVFLKKHRDRVGVLIGATAFLLTVFIMSLFIWSIRITGLETISESEMRALLKENGLSVGTFKPALDSGSLSRAVMLDDRRIGWMAVNITGSYASVELKEEAPAPAVADIHTPANVKARRDGVILRIDTEEGEPMLTEGSGVVEGQLVVGGVLEDMQGGVRLVRAKATILARTSYAADFSIPERGESLVPTGKVTQRLSVKLFGLSIPITASYPEGDYVFTDRVETAPAPLDTDLPVTAVTEKLYGFLRQADRHDREEAEKILTAQAQLYEVFVLSSCTVTDRDYRMRCADGVYTLSAAYTCTEDIAVQENFYVGEDAGE